MTANKLKDIVRLWEYISCLSGVYPLTLGSLDLEDLKHIEKFY